MRWLVDARPLVDGNGGGVCRVGRRLLDAFDRLANDDEIVLATTGSIPPSTDALPTGPNVRHIHLRVPNKLWSAACITGFASLDDACRQPDVQLGRTHGSTPTPRDTDAVFLPNLGFVGRMTRPYVLLLHDLSFLIEPRWFRPKARVWHRAVDATTLITNATHLLAVSETTKRDAIRLLHLPADRITVIPLGPTLHFSSVFPAEAGTPPEGFPLSARSLRGNDKRRFVLALGADDPRKNAATAIDAVAALRREPGFKDVELVLVGQNILPLTKGELEGVPWIRSLAHPTDPELADLYRHAAAFLYPSWYEGYGLPLHEAAAFSTPCIASTAGALPETAPPGTLFADPAKPHHWVEALRSALSVGADLCVRPGSTLGSTPTEAQKTAQPWDEAAAILLQTLRSVTH